MLFAVLGHPIAHSLSPVLHNAAFRAQKRDARYLAFDVPAPLAGMALRGLASLGAGGVSLTAPLKQIAFRTSDTSTPEASEAGAANTVRFAGRRLEAHNTDGLGLVRFLDRARAPVAGRRVVSLGGGGAAAGVLPALVHAGAASCQIVVRNPDADGQRYPALSSSRGVEALPWGSDEAKNEIGRASLVLQCTPLGSASEDLLPCPAEWLDPGALAVDLLYYPPETPWLRALRARGVRAANGLGLLIEQALLAQDFWFGEEPPRRALEEAVQWSDPFAEVRGA